MFNGVVINPEHVLHQFLTEREQTYNLRRRPHGSKTLLKKTQSLNEQDFFIRTMYKHSYKVSSFLIVYYCKLYVIPDRPNVVLTVLL